MQLGGWGGNGNYFWAAAEETPVRHSVERSFVSVTSDLLYLWKSCNLANVVLTELIRQTVGPSYGGASQL